MANFTVSGNAIAVNARLRLRPSVHTNGLVPQFVYTDASGYYTFVNVPPGPDEIVVELFDGTTAPYNTGYSYRNPQGVQVVATNLTNVNFSPVANNAPNPSVNAF